MFQTFRMQIQKYIPEKFYGFVVIPGEERQVFFHLGTFNPSTKGPIHPRCTTCLRKGCSWPETPPPPILGEPVDVVVDFDNTQDGKSPKASSVIRVEGPTILVGKVTIFDGRRGYGFIVDETGSSHYLHRSEVLEGKLPLPGQTVIFFSGVRQGKSRACHVKVCS